MIDDFRNHRGEFCWINPNLFCQEGRCPNCQVYNEEKLCPTCETHLENWLEMFREKCCNYQKEEVV